MGTIKHVYNQTVADGTATSVVRPSDWNSDHNYTMQDAVSLLTAGNTAGVMALISSGTAYLAGGNNVTLSQNANSVSISALASSSLVGVSPITLSVTGSTISFSLQLLSQYDPLRRDEPMVTNSTLGQSSLFFYPVDVVWPVSASRLNVFLSIATTSSNAASSGSGSIGVGYGIYTRMTGASSDRLSLYTSYSASILSYTSSSSSQLRAMVINGLSNATSHSTASTAMSTSNASTYMANSVGGFRAVALPLNVTMTPGRYWIGISQQTTNNASASFKVDASFMQQTISNNIAFRPFGTSSAASNASVYGILDGVGTYSAQSASWPGSIGLTNSDIRLPVSATFPYFNISGFAPATNLL